MQPLAPQPPALGGGGPVPDRLQDIHIAAVRPFLGEAGDLQQEWDLGERRVAEDVLEPVQADVPLTDVLVAVYAARQRALGIVRVDGGQPYSRLFRGCIPACLVGRLWERVAAEYGERRDPAQVRGAR